MSLRSLLAHAYTSILRMLGRHIPSPHEVEKEEQIFYLRYLQPGMIVFDVGANIGEFSLLFSRFVGPEGIVYAFEPSFETFQRLKDIVRAANRRNISLNSLALSNHNGTGSLYVYDVAYSGWTTLASRHLESHGTLIQPVRTETVPMTTIDAYCATNCIERIDLLKIDVEGAEYQVIAGAEQMMAQGRIRCIAFEFGQTTFDMGNSPLKLAQLIESRGYRIRNLNKHAPLFPGGAARPTARFSMHICTPRQ